MKSFKNIYHTVCLTGLIALSTSSCTDWLTIYPQDRVVEENFWEDKNDLEGVRYGAYRQMASTISKLAVWGDLRSDSYEPNSSVQGNQDVMNTHNRYLDIVSGMPDSSMTEFDWGGVYTTINYCNKVLQHGPEVLAKDKQFTSGEWIQMHAEITALRALNYFYLIRAFKDVPYTKKVINKDSEVEAFPLTNQLVILDSIIVDCERVKGKARNRFSDKRDTKGLITNTAIYAMLADMYLWRGSLHEGRHDKNTSDEITYDGQTISYTIADDYNKAIEYADLSLQYLANQNAEEKKSSGVVIVSSGGTMKEETFNYGLTNCDMIKNDFTTATSIAPKLEAQTQIFYTKNSRESIFELQYSQSDNLKNTIVNSLFGSSDGTHLKVNDDAFDGLYKDGITSTADGSGMWDSRLWVCCQDKLTTGDNDDANASSSGSGSGGSYYCMKYHLPSERILNMDGNSTSREIKSVRYTSREYNNWIVYRMTDVMLIKAEALACLGNSNLKSVKAICNAVHRRSYCNYQNSSKVPNTDATAEGTIGNSYGVAKKAKNGCSFSESIVTVMNERQIELIGEGKRWFDLVRLAERSSYSKTDPEDPREPGVTNGQYGMSGMVDQFLGVGSSASYATTLINRFKNRYGLYCPIYYMEVKASNGAIEQNPVWNKSKYEQ
jgi:hypothetical protein